MSTLYEHLGGEAAINAAVDLFYDKALADTRINYFFTDTDMERQRSHQKAFLTFAFGGAPGYDGKRMRDAHAPLVEKMGLNDSHFDAVVENLADSLNELGVNDELIGEVAGIAESIREDILCK